MHVRHTRMPSSRMTASMHVRLTEEEERVLREGHSRCYVSRICAIYEGKITQEKLRGILDKIVGKEEDFYLGLCSKFVISPQRPLWLPDPDFPDYMPDFLLRDSRGNSLGSERSTATPSPGPKLLASRPKVMIRPAKVPYTPKPAAANPPAPTPEAPVAPPPGEPAAEAKETGAPPPPQYWSPQVLQPTRLLGPPAPRFWQPRPPLGIPPPPPKPAVVPQEWWPPAPPKPVAIQAGSTTKGKGKMKGKGKPDVPPRATIAPKKRPIEEEKAHTCIYIHDQRTFMHASTLQNMHVSFFYGVARSQSSPTIHHRVGKETYRMGRLAGLHACAWDVISCMHVSFLMHGFRCQSWKSGPDSHA